MIDVIKEVWDLDDRFAVAIKISPEREIARRDPLVNQDSMAVWIVTAEHIGSVKPPKSDYLARHPEIERVIIDKIECLDILGQRPIVRNQRKIQFQLAQ